MKKLPPFALFIFFAFSLATPCKSAEIKITKLTCENFVNPVGIGTLLPRLGWQLQSDARNVTQTAYRVLVSDDPEKLAKETGNLWDSKKIKSGQSLMVLYNGAPLKPATKYYWKVRVWDSKGTASQWSETGTWSVGLLSHEDWGNAKWIGYEDEPASMRIVPGVHLNGDQLGNKGLQRPVIPLLRKEFDVTKKIASATLFVTGLGQYNAYLNGSKVGNAFLAPGWTDYDKTVLYNTFDVTGNLKQGKNTLGAIVGNGFYNINRERYRKLVINYGTPKFICKLRITYTDGTTQDIDSDSDWKASPSPVLYTSIYGGEDYDARLEQPGWNNTEFDDSCWKTAILTSVPTGKLEPDPDYPVTVNEKLSVKKISMPDSGKYVYDFGQNASGIVEIKVKGVKGQVIRLLPGELLNDKNEINQNATGRWYYYTYTLKGDSAETWRPQFTYYGFRYVQVEGAVPDTTKASAGFARVVSLISLHTCNSSPAEGSFQCSNELFNRIFMLIDWAIRSNLQSVATDCPHREKLGWLEQSFLMGTSINYNYNIYHLYEKMVSDMVDAQYTDGLVPSIVPEYVHFGGNFTDSPEWGSASVIVPWLLYKWYGDISIMEKAWPMMVSYVSYLEKKSDHHILSYGLGDWYDLGPKHPGYAQLTPKVITATSIYYYDLKLLSEMAGILNKQADKDKYAGWAEEVKTTFNTKFFDPTTCVYATGSQTSMSMPLCFGMVDPQYKAKVVANLVDSIKANGKALTAGDIGFHYLVEALTNNGRSKLLFEMNNRDDVPGYGYQLRKGATALTESWQALGGVSNNHLMLGHIMEWFYNGIGGIRQEETSTAYKNIVIKPSVVGDLTSANTSFDSPYGTISTVWKKEEKKFTLKVNIPVNTTAVIYLPANENSSVKEGDIPVEKLKDIAFVRSEEGFKVYKTGSGEYEFEVK